MFRSRESAGYSDAISQDPRRVLARKKIRNVQVQFADSACTVKTREGVVHVQPGDAIMTGPEGDHWRVSHARFPEKYRPVAPTMAGASGQYASLPIRVIALCMDEPFEVLLADGVSKLHGNAGDWLVDYGDGSLGIVARSIFASTYEIVAG
ncbi:MAG TPA: PGDYG domain-containing protein [Steroidobacteraceae bacterium]|jgi:hypothetical protein